MDAPPSDDDASFWPRVLLQLSQRMEEVRQLKDEVAILRRERDEHDSQARTFVEHAAVLIGHGTTSDGSGSQCLIANRILSEQLRVVCTDVQNLQKQNATLEQEHKTALRNVADVREATLTIARLESELSRAKEGRTSDTQKRDVMIQELTQRLADAEHQLQTIRARNESLEKTLSRKNVDELEERNRLLTEDLQKAQEENKMLRTGLHKEKGLMKLTLENLQGSFRKLPQSPPQVPAPKAVQKADTPTATPTLSVPVSVKSERAEDDISFIDLTTPHNQPEYVSHIPESRQLLINSFTNVIIDDDLNHSAMFSRTFLMEHIGGSCQPLVVRIAKSQKPLAEKLKITSYLCPNLELNPWCPMYPGEHGYMFVGLGTEKSTFLKPQVHHLFVGFNGPTKHSQRLFRYMGQYSVSRVDPLSVREWESLTDHVKDGYCVTTKQRTSDSRSIEAIRADYSSGQLQVPCVLLKCIDYNDELAKTLARNVKLTKVPTSSPTKRQREDDDCLSHRKRRSP